MNLYYNEKFKVKCNGNEGSCVDYEFILDDLVAFLDCIVYITGDKPDVVALIAVLLLKNNIKTVILPKMVCESVIIKCFTILNYGGVKIYIVEDKAFLNDWVLGMFTSGSTGNPKLFGFSVKQINKTLDWYHDIYKVDDNSLIITAMPVTYNFTFIAGVCNMASVGGMFISASVEQIPEIIERDAKNYSRIVILANPVLLDNFSDRLLKYNGRNLLIDSGGSPLSKEAIEIYRFHGIDLREGYGLTETCSLTHFDVEAVKESIGTVGKGMEGVKVEFVLKGNRYYAKLYSPNLGRELSFFGEWESESENGYLTTDIVRIDKDGRLELLGRANDSCINGYWPKDTLNLIGKLIGVNCALIQHMEDETIIITFLTNEIDVDMESIKMLVSKHLKISKSKIKIFINNEDMLHSMKIRRKKQNEIS